MNGERIELLSTRLLSDNWALVKKFQELSSQLQIPLGWHYLLDLIWMARLIQSERCSHVIDAGAGIGLAQWWLADNCLDVISIDRWSRRDLPIRFRKKYRVQGLRKRDLMSSMELALRNLIPPRTPGQLRRYPSTVTGLLKQFLDGNAISHDGGTVTIYNQDLSSLSDIGNNSIDVVVSISALEHNSMTGITDSIRELMRVLKPGGKLIATMGAAKDEDWFHEPSKGWCLTEETIRQVFDIEMVWPSNYECYDALFEDLKNCNQLQENLSSFYFQSGDNGMPWGIWAPKYLPVGVVKIKQ